jgi:hypothetical protein
VSVAGGSRNGRLGSEVFSGHCGQVRFDLFCCWVALVAVEKMIKLQKNTSGTSVGPGYLQIPL